MPGAIATVVGTNLTSANGINLASDLPLPNLLVNSTVLVNGRAATPLFAVDNVNGSQPGIFTYSVATNLFGAILYAD